MTRAAVVTITAGARRRNAEAVDRLQGSYRTARLAAVIPQLLLDLLLARLLVSLAR